MSDSQPTPPCDKDTSSLQSDLLFRILGGDAIQALRCGICVELFEVPIVLPCGHTFCLQCLTEMCKEAIQSSASCPLQDLRIGCPQCRVPIYASPILDRNVTCNFAIQSLIESLRTRALDGGARYQHKSVNTDEVRVGSKTRLVGDIELDQVIRDVDRLSETVGKKSVLDLAYFELDDIRRQHTQADEAKIKEGEGLDWARQHPRKPAGPASMSRMGPAQPGLTKQQRQLQNLLQQQKAFQQQQQQQRQQQQQQQHKEQQQQQQHKEQQLQQQQQQQQQQRLQQRPTRPFCWPSVRHPPPPSSISSTDTLSPFVSSSSSASVSLSSLPSSSLTPHAPPPASPATTSTSFRQQSDTHFVLPTQQQQQQQQQQRQLQLHRHEQQTPQQCSFVGRQPLLHSTQQQQQSPHHHHQHQQQYKLMQAFNDSQKPQQNFQQQRQQQQQQLLHQHQQHQQQRHQRHPQHNHPLNAVIGQQQQQQQQQRVAQPLGTTSRLATVLPVQRSGAAAVSAESEAPQGQPSTTLPTPHLPLSILHGHSARLDNDPAVMSYSYRAASGQATPSTGM